MRARICSAISCDMFARVVWMKLWGVAKLPIFTLSFAARTRHARLARLTRARRTRFGRRTARVLLADFWYFWSHKSTTNEKLLYDSSRANNVRPLSRRRQHTCFAYVLIPLPCKTQVQPRNKRKNQMLFSLFLLHMQAQKKKLSKRKRRNKISRSAERDHRCRWTPPPSPKGGRKL